MRLRLGRLVLFVLVVAGGVARAQTQNLGHKTLGTLGLDAGSQPPTGLYAVDAVGAYSSTELIDAHGQRVPIGVDGSALVNVFGVSGTYELPRLHTYVSATLSVPVARVSMAVSSPNANASLDDFGFGDLYFQPLQLGWRPWGQEIVVGYGFYAPTGHFAPGGLESVGAGQWTHEISGGGTVYFDHAHTWKLSALASYQLDGPKLGIDVQRGNSIQFQGGVGKRLIRIVDLGVVGYGLWQVTNDSGSALPAELAGVRDVDCGLGGEISLDVQALRAKVTVRYTHDVFVRSRPIGDLVFMAISFSVWKPR